MEENATVELLTSPAINDPAWTASNDQAGETARLQVAEAGAREPVLKQNPEHTAGFQENQEQPFLKTELVPIAPTNSEAPGG